MKSKKRYPRTKAQREFIQHFEGELLFQFMEDTTQTFEERVRANIRWVRDHVSDRTQWLERKADRMQQRGR